MDDLPETESLNEQETDEEECNEEIEEQSGEQEQSSDDYYSYSSTDTSIDLAEHKHLLHEFSHLELPSSPVNLFESGEEEETQKSKSGTIEILSEQSELSDESAWDKDVPAFHEKEESFIEEITEASFEQIMDTKVEQEEDAFEQTFVESEEMEEEEEEEEEELLAPEEFEEWEKEQKIAQFQRDLEEVLTYEFPEDRNQAEEIKLLTYESMLRDLERDDKEIDVMLKEVDKNEDKIKVIERTLGPLITHYEKEVSAFRKVGDDGFADLEGEEEEEEVEDEYMSRAAEMAKEILEADDIESVGSLGKESSGDDLSNMLSQMAADLKDSEPEVVKEDQPGSRKTPIRQKKKTVQGRRSSKQKADLKKKKK